MLFSLIAVVVPSYFSAAQTTLTFSRTVEGDGAYHAGASLDLTITFEKNGPDPLTQLGLTETLPPGWTFVSVTTPNGPEITPSSGSSGDINFAWIMPPSAFPYSFTYRVIVPTGTTGIQVISGTAIYATFGPQETFGPLSTSIPEGTPSGGGEGEGQVEGQIEGEGEGQATTDMLLSRSIPFGSYTPGSTLIVRVTLEYFGADPVSTLGLEETIPSGWTFDGIVSGSAPQIQPSVGSSGTLSFAWISVPPFPIQFQYRLNVPSDATGTQKIIGQAQYRTTGDPLFSNVATTDIPQGALEGEGQAEGQIEGQVEGQVEGQPTSGMRLERAIPSGGYTAGTPLLVNVTLEYFDADPVTALGLEETIPSGWTFDGVVSGSAPQIQPSVGSSGTLSFAWVSVPPFPITFQYRLNVPSGVTGVKQIVGQAQYRTTGDPLVSNVATTDIPEGALEGEGEGSATATLLLQKSASGGTRYAPGGTKELVVQIDYEASEPPTTLHVRETLPDAAEFVSVTSTPMPDQAPRVGQRGTLDFVWETVPESPVFLRYVVRFDADAAGNQLFSGFGALTVGGSEFTSDTVELTLEPALGPDLVPAEIQAPPILWIGQSGGVQWRVDNIGDQDAAGTWQDCVYLSSDTSYSPDDVALACPPGRTPLRAGGKYTQDVSFTVPSVAPGPYFLLAVADVDQTLAESNEGNNISSAVPVDVNTVTYDATVTSAQVNRTDTGRVLEVRGHTRNLDSGSAESNVPVVVQVTTDNVTRSMDGMSDAFGQFAIPVPLLDGEGGTYGLAARHPGVPPVSTQTTIDIPALVAEPGVEYLSLAVGTITRFTFSLRNVGAVALTRINASLADLPPSITADISLPDSLALGELSNGTVVFQARDTSVSQAVVHLNIIADQPVISPITLYLKVLSQSADLNVEPNALQAGSYPGQQSFYEFFIKNNGGQSVSNLSLVVDSLPWVSVLAPATPQTLSPLGNLPVTLQILPPAELSLGQYSGNVRLQYGSGETLSLPLTVILEENPPASLSIRALSEDAAGQSPGRAAVGVHVSLWDPVAQTFVAEAVTNSQGRAAFNTLPAGNYELEANGPGFFRVVRAVHVRPGERREEEITVPTVFMQRDIQIQDGSGDDVIYQVTENTSSVVPAPLISLEPAVLDFRRDESVTVRIRNVGTATAYRLRWILPEHPRFAWIPWSVTLEDLAPGESIEVPVALLDNGGADSCDINGTLGISYYWLAGTTKSYRREALGVVLPPTCDAAEPRFGDVTTLEEDRAAFVTPSQVSIPIDCGESSECLRATVRVEDTLVAAESPFVLQGFFTAGDTILRNIRLVPRFITEAGASADTDFDVLDVNFTEITSTDAGTLAAGRTAFVEWRIRPRRSAAALTTTRYRVFISASFTRLGQPVEADTLTENLIVMPVPQAHVDAFFPSEVYADDPSTEIQEPQNRFNIGLWVQPEPMTVQQINVLSLSPQVSTLDSAAPTPLSLTRLRADGGDLPPRLGVPLDVRHGLGVASWRMNPVYSALQTAPTLDLARRDTPRTERILDAFTLTSHNLLRVVRVPFPINDNVPDFLVDDDHDAATLPEVIYVSDGTLTPVATGLVQGVVPESDGITFHVQAVMPDGWGYVRFDSPLDENYVLDSVQRSDGQAIPPDNAWFTSRAIRQFGGVVTVRREVHILDFDGTDSYRVAFRFAADLNESPVAIVTPSELTAGLGQIVVISGRDSFDPDGDSLTYQWRFAEKPSGSALSLDTSDADTVAFVPDRRGDYRLELVVNDGELNSLPAYAHVTIPNARPVANAGEDQRVPLGATVTLNGSTSFDPDSDPLVYRWRFVTKPAASSAVLQNSNTPLPTFVADAPGEYQVELIVSDGALDSLPDGVVVRTLNSAPTAEAGPDKSARVGEVVVFDGSGSRDPDGDPLLYSWTIIGRPANSTAALQNPNSVSPRFVPDRKGTYTIQLVVSDGALQSLPDILTLTVINSPPVADAGVDVVGHVGETVVLDGTASRDPDGDALIFTWTIESAPLGSAALLSNPTSARPTFVPDKKGEYLLALVVSDGQLSSMPSQVRVTVVNRPPVADAGPSKEARSGERVTLDGRGSQDPDGDALAFSWRFIGVPEGTSPVLDAADTATPSFVPSKRGEYVLELIVNDGEMSSAPSQTTVNVPNTPPTARITVQGERFVGETLTLDGSASDDADGDTLSFRWELLARPEGSAAVVENATSSRASLRLDRKGTYSVGLIVNDGFADSVQASATIVPGNRAPVADAGDDLSGVRNVSLVLDGSRSRDPDGDGLTYLWTVVTRPTGSIAELEAPDTVAPRFTPDQKGTYVIQLVVSDGTDSSTPDFVQVTVPNRAPTANAGPDQTRRVGSIVSLDGSLSRDPDGDLLTYQWTLLQKPTGSTATLNASSSVSPTFQIDKAGNYIIQLVVFDGTEFSAPDTVTVSTENSRPVANAGPDQTRRVGERASLDGSASFDPDGDPLFYTWTLLSSSSGAKAQLLDANSVQAVLIVDSPGTYTVQLVVDDGILESEPDVVVISTTNSAPVARISSSGPIRVGQIVALDGSSSSDPDGDTLTYAWSLVSKPSGSTAALTNITSVATSLPIDISGSYVVQLIVHDGTFASDPATLTLNTENSPPIARAGENSTATLGQLVTLDGTQSSDPDGDPITYLWTLTAKPEASRTTLNNRDTARPTFRVDVAGTYVVTLVVNDGRVSSAPDAATIMTVNAKPVANAGTSRSVMVGSTVTLDGRGSFDPERSTLAYQWRLLSKPSGSTAQINNPAAAQTFFLADLTGEYRVQLVVNDGELDSDPAEIIITAGTSCPTAPPPVSGVTASDGTFADRVEVTWEAAPGATQYRVWRSTQNDPTTAVAITDWVEGTTQPDTTAAPPVVTVESGCPRRERTDPVYYFYWVQARNSDGCENALSGGDRGHRGMSAKAAIVQGEVRFTALPTTWADEEHRKATPTSSLAVRLFADAAFAEVWGYVEAEGFFDDAVTWVPTSAESASDGWVLYTPAEPWNIGAVLQMHVGGRTQDGSVVEHTERFLVEEADPPEIQEDEGAGAEPSVHYLAIEDFTATTPATTIVRVSPPQPFTDPYVAWVPLAVTDEDIEVRVFCLYEDTHPPIWYPADRVVGLLASSEWRKEKRDGRFYVGIPLRHAATLRVEALPIVRRSASAAYSSIGTMLLFAGALGVLTLLRYQRFLR